MSDSLGQLRRSVTPQDRTLLDQLATIAQEFSNLTYRGPEKLSAETYRERLDTLAQQQDELQAQLATRSAALKQTLVPITLDAVRQAVPNGATLVEWFRYQPFDPKVEPTLQRYVQPRYVAYILRRAVEPVAIDVGEAQAIEDLITKFRRALLDPTSDSRGARRVAASRVDVKQMAADLSEILIKPLRPHLAQSERLLISPDGALNLVPFAALLDEHGEYLAQHFEISYLTSGRDLLRIGDAPTNGESVVLAAPSYGKGGGAQLLSEAALQPVRSAEIDRSGLVFNPLPGTAAEAEALQFLLQLDTQHVLTGDRATESELRSLHGPRILHLAKHGFFLKDEDLPAVFSSSSGWDDKAALPIGENPLLRSGLALAGANERHSGDTDDGILTAAEVAQLDLVGTQLVVLSACETALGTVDAGEGVYGLRRALVLAGAQSQLVSLWKVGDAATQALMTEYYQRLLNREGPAAALRSVQLSMLADPARQHPYYWAAFIPIGNWAPLSQPTAKGSSADARGSGEVSTDFPDTNGTSELSPSQYRRDARQSDHDLKERAAEPSRAALRRSGRGEQRPREGQRAAREDRRAHGRTRFFAAGARALPRPERHAAPLFMPVHAGHPSALAEASTAESSWTRIPSKRSCVDTGNPEEFLPNCHLVSLQSSSLLSYARWQDMRCDGSRRIETCADAA